MSPKSVTLQLEISFNYKISLQKDVNKRIMNKKDYEKPTMRVVELQQRTMLLAGSVVNAIRYDYGDANPDVAPAELNDAGEWEWN